MKMRDVNAITAYVEALKPSIAGQVFYYILPFRKKVVLSNIQTAYGDILSEASRTRLAKAFYTHVARCLFENIKMRFMSLERLKQTTIVKGSEHVPGTEGDPKPVLIFTGHFGNWELAPIAGILKFEALKGRFHFIRKTLNIKFLEKWLFRRYYRAGLNVIPKQHSLNQVCDALDQNDAVVFVMDQHASIHNRDGVLVDFFGKPAGTYRSLATVARYIECPVVPATSYRQANGQHVLEFFPAIPWVSESDKKLEVIKNTQRYNDTLEAIIDRHPDQWLWMHKRWKGAV